MAQKFDYVVAPGDGTAVSSNGAGLEGTFGGWCSCGYVTHGWPTQEVAAERLAQHANEHETGELMEDLVGFRDRLGLVPDGRQKAVFPKGAVPLVLVGTEEEAIGD